MFTRRQACVSILLAPFAFNCGGDEREESSGSTVPPPAKPTPPRVLDPDYPEVASHTNEPALPVESEPDERAEGTSNIGVDDQSDFVSVLDDLYERAGDGNVILSDAWNDLFGQPAVVSLRIGGRVYEDCLYFTFDDEPILGPDAGVLMEVDRATRAVRWWCGAERLEI